MNIINRCCKYGGAVLLSSTIAFGSIKAMAAEEVYLAGGDVSTIALVSVPSVIQDAFQDMKNFIGLNILKYSEEQARLEAIIPPDAVLSKKNGALIAFNESFVEYWNKVFFSNSLIRNLFFSPTANANTNLVFRHLSNYCSTEEAQRGVCWPASSDGNDVYVGAADLNFGTILDYASYPNSAGYPTDSGLSTSGVQTAAIDFINNLTNPNPIPLPGNIFNPALPSGLRVNGLSAGLARTTNLWGKTAYFRPTASSQDANLAALYRQMAILSIPQRIMMDMVAERTEVPGLGTSVGITDIDPSKQNISTWEALQYEATRRYASEEWHDGINSSPSTAVLREIANIEALQAAMQFRQIQQAEEIKALLAAQIGILAQTQAQAAIATQQQP